ncbi:MAG: hypothetical protein PHN90_10065 [Methanothrix sp.]|jgi:hypothetical protein|nr:hypothetical protein [Methanothrix harundinacea]MDD3565997.1 hypothetical protein [Methanothrix sp.]MDD5515714.1 hypothetical protein [Synergistales bacterium]
MATPKIIYETESGENITSLREDARKLRDEAAKLQGVRGMEAGAREREAEAARLEERAGELWEAARLEALTVYIGQVEKITAKGPKTYEYYFASWKMGGKVVNKYIGSPRKMTLEEATAKARELKRRDLHLSV